MRSEFRRGVLASGPVLVGLVPYAMVLGAQASQKGLSAAEVPLMTGLNFAGGSEFAAVQLWTSPPNLFLIAAVTLLVNSRYIVMGAALSTFMGHVPRRKALPALAFMSDASWALAFADAKRRAAGGSTPAFSLPFYMGASLSGYVTWVVFTALGAVLGPFIGNLETWGIDMAFPAVFLVILRGMWRGVSAARPWIVSLGAAALTYLFVPGAWYVPAGALSGILAAYVLADGRA
jgi:4-azaleucine resistance transporter AzlC